MDPFLRATDVIDFGHPAVRALASQLAAGDPAETARRAFEWVRDRIVHTDDRPADVVPCAASEVLAAGTGFCYAKCHLLAALLRANGVPAALALLAGRANTCCARPRTRAASTVTAWTRSGANSFRCWGSA